MTSSKLWFTRSLSLLLLSLASVSAFAVDCNTSGFACTNLDTQIKGSRLPMWGTDSGSANAYAITTIAPLGPSLRTGSRFMFIATHANTSASTLAVDGGSAIAIKKNVSTALASGDIGLNGVIEVTYDGTNFQIVGNGALSFANLSGSLACSQMPAGTGDVTWSAGSCTTSYATTLPVNKGGTGTASTLTGLVRGNASAMTAAELSGDATTSGSNAVTLASVVTAGTCGDATHSCGLTYDVKGRITAATNNVISGGGGGSGALVGPLSGCDLTASSSAELDFPSCFSSTYDTYVLMCNNILLATNTQSFYLRFTTNNGSTYDSGANYGWSGYRWNRTGAAAGGFDSGQAQIDLDGQGTADFLSNGAVTGGNPGFSGTFWIVNPLGSTGKELYGKSTFINTSSVIPSGSELRGNYFISTALTGFKVFSSSGNITSGTCRVYGYAN